MKRKLKLEKNKAKNQLHVPNIIPVCFKDNYNDSNNSTKPTQQTEDSQDLSVLFESISKKVGSSSYRSVTKSNGKRKREEKNLEQFISSITKKDSDNSDTTAVNNNKNEDVKKLQREDLCNSKQNIDGITSPDNNAKSFKCRNTIQYGTSGKDCDLIPVSNILNVENNKYMKASNSWLQTDICCDVNDSIKNIMYDFSQSTSTDTQTPPIATSSHSSHSKQQQQQHNNNNNNSNSIVGIIDKEAEDLLASLNMCEMFAYESPPTPQKDPSSVVTSLIPPVTTMTIESNTSMLQQQQQQQQQKQQHLAESNLLQLQNDPINTNNDTLNSKNNNSTIYKSCASSSTASVSSIVEATNCIQNLNKISSISSNITDNSK